MRFLRKLLTLGGLFLLGVNLYSQSNVPQGIYYQAVARDDMGNEMTNENLAIQISIKENGLIIYTETHSPNTDDYGLFEILIGLGQVQEGVFAEITWSEPQYSLLVELDSGSGYEEISETSFLSVPFSLYSAKAYEVEIDNVDDADSDATNELISNFEVQNDSLSILENGIAHSVPLSSIGNDEDWILNEDSTMMSTLSDVEQVGIREANPQSTLHVNGSFALAVTTITSDDSPFDVQDYHAVILCDVSSGNIEINLPPASESEGRMYTIKKYDPGNIGTTGSDVILNPVNGETVEGEDPHELTDNDFEQITIISDGGLNWWVIAR